MVSRPGRKFNRQSKATGEIYCQTMEASHHKPISLFSILVAGAKKSLSWHKGEMAEKCREKPTATITTTTSPSVYRQGREYSRTRS